MRTYSLRATTAAVLNFLHPVFRVVAETPDRDLDSSMALEDPQALILAGVAVLAALYVVRWKTHPVSRERNVVGDEAANRDHLNTQLNPIPTVGGSGAPGLAILTALNFWRNGKQLLEEGYQKVCVLSFYLRYGITDVLLVAAQYYGTSFKVAYLDKWLVVVSGPEMLDELRRRPDEEVSFLEGAEEVRNAIICLSLAHSLM